MKTAIGKNGFTLLEMSVVLMVLLALMGTGLFVSSQIGSWQAGRDASETLRTVYAAQRMYLADNPTAVVSNITDSQIIPYLPNRAASLPTVQSLTGQTLTIRVNVSPPVINGAGGEIYDPSGSPNDSLWDVGK